MTGILENSPYGANIPDELGQYHGCWYPGYSRRQVIMQ